MGSNDLVRHEMKKQIYLALSLPILLAACENVDPVERQQANHLPPDNFTGDAMQGKGLFREYCLACHGNNALGSDKGPALVDNIYRPAHHADLAFRWAVSKGVMQHHWRFGDMPPLPDVTPEQLAHIISFVRLAQQRAGIK
jgi:mono/diheme cytochrome c family protein